MTKWKRREREVIIMMHAHNLWSRWYDCIMSAADELGLVVSTAHYRNHYDGSPDTEYYVSAEWLARVGGKDRLMGRAYEIQREGWEREAKMREEHEA